MKYIIILGLLSIVTIGYTIYTSETLEILSDSMLWDSCVGNC